MVKSLFVLALPHSLSTTTYHVARAALSLWEPSWTIDGEILNLDRMAAYRGPRADECAKYTTSDAEPDLFHRLTDFLDQVTVPEGAAYKDVVQPFAVSSWSGITTFAVLRIDRDPAEVAYSLLSLRRYYPQAAALGSNVQSSWPRRLPRLGRHEGGSLSLAVVEGLVRADMALDNAPAVTVSYDDLIESEATLAQALGTLYPEQGPLDVSYIDPLFCAKRRFVMRRRDSPHLHRLRDMVAACRERLAGGVV